MFFSHRIYSYIAAASLTVTTSNVAAWTITADFENGAPGAIAQAPTTADAFHGQAGDSKIISTPVFSGVQAASVTATKGESGFGTWGGGIEFPSDLKQGDEVWFRVVVRYPDGWTFGCNSCTEGMKFMRLHVASSSGSNRGYIHTFIRKNNDGEDHLLVSTEINNKNSSPAGNSLQDNYPANFDRADFSPKIERDRWYTFEMYVKFAADGSGAYRLWQDGELVFEADHYQSLISSTDKSDRVYIYTYWNNGVNKDGGPPQTQTAYIDDIIITSDTPANVDSQGNPYIGAFQSIPVANPGKATGVSVTRQ